MHLFLDENVRHAPSVHFTDPFDTVGGKGDPYPFTVSGGEGRTSVELHLTEAEAVRLAHFILTHANKETTA